MALFPSKRADHRLEEERLFVLQREKGDLCFLCLSLSRKELFLPSFLLYQRPANVPVTSLLRIARQMALVKDLASNVHNVSLFSQRERYIGNAKSALCINEN